uniref:Helix-turn-helix domain-containing protein n=1 Tax=Dictyoglomus turgidum TaxID=513050 RepID=A0A7C3WL09_9BACT
MEEEKKNEGFLRDFKGIWIPKEIWFADDINFQEKLLWAEIDSLDGENGCNASNGYFAEFFNLSEWQISRYISDLKEKRYIWEEKFDGRQRILHSSLRVDPKADFGKTQRQLLEKPKVYNKDYNNNLFINKKINKNKLNKPNRLLQIISLYIKEIGLKPENKEQFRQIVKRNLRAAKSLIGYSDEQIKKTIEVCKNTDYLKKITLETITKYIDQVVAEEQKKGPKIIRWEQKETKDGRKVMVPIYEEENQKKVE